jgi:predicted DNA-binding protein|tara:strand:+ start:65 stop:505 length:441 start_codon:yes stop_codon:yes gene_type:complete
MTSVDDIFSMFHDESEKLENLINNATTKSELSIHEIIETYFQIMNVSSMAVMLKQQLQTDEHKILLDKIIDIERVISEKFNSSIHPQVLKKLTKSIQDSIKNLQSEDSKQKSKEDIENKAKLYEELRQKMSTKEFVEQYDKELSHD